LWHKYVAGGDKKSGSILVKASDTN
jgi:hypothetical protein